MQDINTEDIMEQIRSRIKEKGFDYSLLSFDDVPTEPEISHAEKTFQLASLQQSAEYLNIRNQIEPYKPIEGNFLVVFIKKVIRKLMKFHLMPIITEQNALNLHTANAVNQMQCYIQEQQKKDISALISRIDALEVQVKTLQEENKELKGLKL